MTMMHEEQLETQLYPLFPLEQQVGLPGSTLSLLLTPEEATPLLDKSLREACRSFILGSPALKTFKFEGENYQVGALAQLARISSLGENSSYKALFKVRSRVLYPAQSKEKRISIRPFPTQNDYESGKLEAYTALVTQKAKQYFLRFPVQSKKALEVLEAQEDSEKFLDLLAVSLPLSLEEKQSFLAEPNLVERGEILLNFLTKGLKTLEWEKVLKEKVKSQIEKHQREYLLHEQLKAIQKELGHHEREEKVWEEKLSSQEFPKEVKSVIEEEIRKIKSLPTSSTESHVVKGHLEWLLKFPWKKASRTSIVPLSEAEAMLEASHYGLKEVKERILEYLAVQARRRKMNGEILCLVGPPGTGKTSLAASIAKVLRRKFCKISLGGLRDEAELRGHRRTYVSALPGRFAQELCRVGVNNPVLLLDEIDKIGQDSRGDPSAVLLEALDRKQNHAFQDDYLGLPIDLSRVLFVATANSTNLIKPLRDRIEFIETQSYTEEEKFQVLERYLIPKQLKLNGMEEEECQLTEVTKKSLISEYTREAGVRELERQLNKIYRKVVRLHSSGEKPQPCIISEDNLHQYLGPKRYLRFNRPKPKLLPGRITGLAWTEVGGECLKIEAVPIPGKGKLVCTGRQGEVMKESAQAALTLVRRYAEKLGIDRDYFTNHDFHIHVTEGSVPKEGPSAGVAMSLALLSAITDSPIDDHQCGFTGEITLSGRVLRIGGLKEKLLAARREGLKEVFIPAENLGDLEKIPKEERGEMIVYPVEELSELVPRFFGATT